MDYYSNFQDTSFLVTALVSHLLIAIPLWKMAQKKKVEPAWFAWVPVLNGLVTLKLVKKPLWWIILFFIPIINIVIGVIVMMDLCEAFGANKWWGLLALFSPAAIVLFYVLAFMERGIPVAAPSGGTPEPAPAPAATPTPAPEPSMAEEVEAPEAAPEKSGDPDLSTPPAPKTE